MNAAERAARQAELRREYRERKARALEDEGDEHGAAEVRAGRCACGCRHNLGSAARKVYNDVRCRQRHHRARLQRAAEAAGVPSRLSLAAIEAANRTHERHGDAPARRPRRRSGPRPGVTIYLPTLELAEDALRALELVGQYADGEHALEVAGFVQGALERRRKRDAESPSAVQ